MKYSLGLLFVFYCFFAAAQSSGNYLAKVLLNGKWGFIDTSGHEVIPALYDDIDINEWNNNLIAANKGGLLNKERGAFEGGKWGFLDGNGKEAIPFKFNGAASFHEDLAKVKIGSNWGFINMRNTLVIMPKYSWVSSFSNGRAFFKKGGSIGYIDKQGNEIIKAKYNQTTVFEEGFACAFKGKMWDNTWTDIEYGGWGIIDTNGKEWSDFIYSYISPFHNGIAIVGSIVAINDNIKASFRGEKANFRKYLTKYCFINTKIEMIVPMIYDTARDFSSDSIAIVGILEDSTRIWSSGYKYGYINREGKEIVKPQYEIAGDFQDGYAVVKNGAQSFGVIDKTGKAVWDNNWQQLIPIGNNRFIAQGADNLMGVVNIKGEILIPIVYEELKYLGNDLFMSVHSEDAVILGNGEVTEYESSLIDIYNKTWFTTKDYSFSNLLNKFEFGVLPFSYHGKYGLITKEGKIIVEAKYDFIQDFQQTDRKENTSFIGLNRR